MDMDFLFKNRHKLPFATISPSGIDGLAEDCVKKTTLLAKVRTACCIAAMECS